MNPPVPGTGQAEAQPRKPKLLIIELWGMGDLVIATPFLQKAVEKYEVTLLAKPYALELQTRLWPGIKIIPFVAPWTAFKNKYHLWRWPFHEILKLRRTLAGEHFEYGLSGRWDPRDHILLQMIGVRHRLGFPRIKSGLFLTQRLPKPGPLLHHYEYWRIAGEALGISLPAREKLLVVRHQPGTRVLVHSGARLTARVWPVENYIRLVRRLRDTGHTVQVACDPDQLGLWQKAGETSVACPQTVLELLSIMDDSRAFIGNCSGPGHLAAITGLPTFTFFGPSLQEWFAPLHPAAEWLEGKACPYKPCSDYCRWATPECLWKVTVEEAWPKVEKFVERQLQTA